MFMHHSLLTALVFFNSIAFLFYGIGCLFNPKLKVEFERFGLSPWQRKITGISQLMGSVGLLIGYYLLKEIALLSTIGLSVLMYSGFMVRIKIKDSWQETLPSFFFLVLNGILSYTIAVSL